MNEQISIRLPTTLFRKAKQFSKKAGYGTVQELIRETLREKLFDEPILTQKELALVTKIAKMSEETGDYVEEEEIRRILRE